MLIIWTTLSGSVVASWDRNGFDPISAVVRAELRAASLTALTAFGAAYPPLLLRLPLFGEQQGSSEDGGGERQLN